MGALVEATAGLAGVAGAAGAHAGSLAREAATAAVSGLDTAPGGHAVSAADTGADQPTGVQDLILSGAAAAVAALVMAGTALAAGARMPRRVTRSPAGSRGPPLRAV